MTSSEALARIKRDINGFLGDDITLKTNVGRKKIHVSQGVVEKAYPSIFMISIEPEVKGQARRSVSFSYSDVLTKTIELCDKNDDNLLKYI